MNWKKIDPLNLPEEAVIATDGFGFVLVGYLELRGGGGIDCDSEETRLEDVTHYITLTELLESIPYELDKD